MPGLTETSIADEVRDKDAGMKGRAKLYANKRQAVESLLVPGDKVLVKKRQENKLATPFASEPHEVISKHDVIVESSQGVQ